jgi:hypothetical protein
MMTEGGCYWLKLPTYKYQDSCFLNTFGMRIEKGVGFYAWILCQLEFFLKFGMFDNDLGKATYRRWWEVDIRLISWFGMLLPVSQKCVFEVAVLCVEKCLSIDESEAQIRKAHLESYSATLSFIFASIIKIRDARLEEFLADLMLLREAGSTDEESIESLYKLIQSSSSGNYDIVRYVACVEDFRLNVNSPEDELQSHKTTFLGNEG